MGRGKKYQPEQVVNLLRQIEEHLTSFREHGQMHMRTMHYFADEEGGNIARGDRFENQTSIARETLTIFHPDICFATEDRRSSLHLLH
jgi:hypothetical protein